MSAYPASSAFHSRLVNPRLNASSENSGARPAPIHRRKRISNGGGRQGDVASGRARVVQLKADEVRTALEPVLLEIIRGIQRIIEEAPPEATADIYHYGIMLTGGGALLAGLTERLREELQLQVILADDLCYQWPLLLTPGRRFWRASNAPPFVRYSGLGSIARVGSQLVTVRQNEGTGSHGT